MISFSSMLLAVQVTVPNTGTTWNWIGTPIIIGSCLLCLLIIPRTISYPHVGNKMPLPFPGLFNNPSVGSFLAAMSAGHLIGIGAVLGLTNLGII
ncbi:photosystem I reaction center subunit PsaK [Microcystis aeruginosa CS-567/02-A1]|uniref:photosystem I reaction center subunit PsaK n=2 Tax=Cyanophyceae TaxID=3028117 RepID=UPI00232E4681|nr:photosystem I reaction center subunit PsaK [Microcystis aeruginosa]MDB9398729.1 photosystem I reaction center subunit PsaK [Microcystis aeruginosa CS-567/02-A1]